MLRSLWLGALALVSVGRAVEPITIKPTWTLKQTTSLGFNDQGEVVTAPKPKASYRLIDPGKPLDVRDPRSGAALRQMDWLAWADFQVARSSPRRDVHVSFENNVLVVKTAQGEWSSGIQGLQGTEQMLLSPDGQTLVLTNINGYVQLWDVASGVRRTTMLLHAKPESIAFHPTLPILAINERWNEDSVSLWSLQSGQKIITVPGVGGISRPFQFLPDGTLLHTQGYLGYSAVLTSFDLTHWQQGDIGLTSIKFPVYIEGCQGFGFQKCARGILGGSVSNDGQRILLNIRHTELNKPAALLYTKSGKLLKVLLTDNTWASLAPDGQNLILGHLFPMTHSVSGAPIP